MVVKTPPAGFMRFLQKTMRPFLKETVWYTLALPTLAAKFPILEEVAPRCYHAYARGVEDLSGGCWERACCSMCYAPCRRYEKGLIMLQDLTRAEPAFYLGGYSTGWVILRNEVTSLDLLVMRGTSSR